MKNTSLPGQTCHARRAVSTVLILVASFVAALAAAVVFSYLPETVTRSAATQVDNGPDPSFLQYMIRERPRLLAKPGLTEPPTYKAREARLADSEEIIGIVVKDKSRAYVVRAFEGHLHHIVNDLLYDVPISITFCDITHCAAVFTCRMRGRPLDLIMGGMASRHMLLMVGEDRYYQDTLEPYLPGKLPSAFSPDGTATPGHFPFERHSFTRTTWQAWKEDHPQTDVYVGG